MKFILSLFIRIAGDQRQPSRFVYVLPCGLALAFLALTPAVRGTSKPTRLAQIDARPRIVRLPDGSHMGLFLRNQGDSQEVAAIYSSDNGTSWSAPRTVLPLPTEPGRWGGLQAIVDDQNELQVLVLNDAKTGVFGPEEERRQRRRPISERRIDIWHTRSSETRRRWIAPQKVWEGYTGSINSLIQMHNGRIVLPFAYLTKRTWRNRGEGFDEFTFMGTSNTTAIYSDDRGASWGQAPAHLRVQTPNTDTYGAVEPVILQLKDGRIWMLIRNQLGRLYQSFSADGAHWSEPQPTSIYSSDSPVGLVRLDDGRIVLLWNGCLRYPYALGGRHVLHAAISEDEGKTWRGYREVVRDPKRDEPPPPGGDHGTAYPFPALGRDGQVLFTTGQGEGRVLVMRLDPEWLYETTQREDFSDGLEEWSVFGTRGVGLVPHPSKDSRKVLSIKKAASHWQAAAVWNFPNGREGILKLRLLPRSGFQGARIMLSDHYSTPFDDQDQFFSLFNLEIPADGRISPSLTMQPDRWYDIEIAWSIPRREAQVRVDGEPVPALPLRRNSHGASYLRLRATSESIDDEGFLVESVSVETKEH